MTREEAKDVFLNRGFVKVNGGEIFDGDKWRQSVVVISEWLKQEPCEGCISREKAKQFLYERLDRLNNDDLYDIFSTIIDDMYNELPSVTPQPKWIPVSERLPKENGWYQCTLMLDDLPLTMELFYKNGKWLDNRRINMFNTYDIYGYGNTKEKHKLSYQELISEFNWTENVIAWMPLPEPYKAESEDKE